LGDTALRTARRLGLPLVFTHHTLYERYTHYVPLDSEAMRRFAVHLAKTYANMCTQVVAPSQSIADLIRGRGVRRAVKVIPTGVDVASFRKGDGRRFREAEGIARDALVIGHLGRLAPEKNLGYLSEAVGLFMQEEPQAHYLVVGKGPSEKEIARLFDEKGLSGRLTLAGEKVGTDLTDAYKAMDIFVFASTSETQGMVLVEAMAAGNPVVALEAPGVREVVLDGKNGRLLPPQASPAKFGEAIREIAEDEKKREEWGSQALKTAAVYDRKICAGSLSALYASLAKDPMPASDQDREFVNWESLLNNIRAEWDLLTQKLEALQGTVTDL
jgi:glycosyltransferase involved in cell wall biosynthesis